MITDVTSQSRLKQFNSKNLAAAIRKAFPFLTRNPNNLKRELDEFIFPRLDFMAVDKDGARFFLFEERYVETEWKDMIGMHYINTSYQVENTVMRIHLFTSDVVEEEHYIGCFTMRTINETLIMLSYIYPNWKKLIYKGNMLNVMTYKKKVHLNGREIVFDTYPLFAQDNAVVTCAQACLVSMSKYLHSRYDYTMIRVGNINDSYHSDKTKIYPSPGLRSTQMLEILYSHNIPCEYQVYHQQEGFKEYIDYCVESALPVLVGLHVTEAVQESAEADTAAQNDAVCSGKSEAGDVPNEKMKGNGNEKKIGCHVIQIIGHTDGASEKEYVIYDDSGYYLKSLGETGFVKCVSWEVLCRSLEPGKDFIIYPIHDKVYILFDYFKMHMNDMLVKTKANELMEKGDMDRTGRVLLADNREVKRFLRDEVVDNLSVPPEIQTVALGLLSLDMPHYLWCCEYRVTTGWALYLADPTYNRRTIKNIFINKEPLICDSQIGLLRYD